MMKRIFYIALGLALLGSCVPSGKFTELTDKSNSLQGERDELMAENEQLTVENREMKAKIGQVAEQQKKLTEDSIRIHSQVEELEKEIMAGLFTPKVTDTRVIK